jgi:uncharacterized OB-fold protein
VASTGYSDWGNSLWDDDDHYYRYELERFRYKQVIEMPGGKCRCGNNEFPPLAAFCHACGRDIEIKIITVLPLQKDSSAAKIELPAEPAGDAAP